MVLVDAQPYSPKVDLTARFIVMRNAAAAERGASTSVVIHNVLADVEAKMKAI
jgi:hypothetical protein